MTDFYHNLIDDDEPNTLVNREFNRNVTHGVSAVDEFGWVEEHGGSWLRDQEFILEELQEDIDLLAEYVEYFGHVTNRDQSRYNIRYHSRLCDELEEMWAKHEAMSISVDQGLTAEDMKAEDVTVGESLITTLKHTVDTMTLNQLVSALEYAENMFTDGELPWGDYVIAGLVTTFRLDKMTRPRAGWDKELARFRRCNKATTHKVHIEEGSSYNMDMEDALDKKRIIEECAARNGISIHEAAVLVLEKE